MAYYDGRYRYYRQPPSAYPHTREPNGGYYPEPRPMEMVYRHDGRDDSVEEIPRDFPPGDSYYYDYYGYPRRTRRSRSMGGGGHGPYTDGASDPRRRRHGERRHRRSRYSPSPSAESSRNPSPRRQRRKSLGEKALDAVGLGGALGTRNQDGRGRSHLRHHRSYSASPHRRDKSEQRIAQAVKAALTAGAVEALRVRNEPGPWTGDKGKRIITAAIASAGTDGLLDKNPNKNASLKIIESTLAGLATNHVVNGSESRSRSRSRARSQGRGKDHAARDVAIAGLVAAVGKEIYDRYRSRSHNRGRSSSRDSDDHHNRGSRRRSKSVSDYINKGMAALGLDDHSDQKREGRSSRYDDYSNGGYGNDTDGAYGSRQHYGGGGNGGGHRRGRESRDVGRYGLSSIVQSPVKARSASGTRSRIADGEGPNGGNGSNNNLNSDSDLGDSSDEKEMRKELRNDALLTSGMAAVATLHAAHTVHANMEKRKERRKELQEGEMTPEEARKLRQKANLKDLASLGLAAIGIYSAASELKEAYKKVHEHGRFTKDSKEKHAMREQHRRSKSHGPPSRNSDPYEYWNQVPGPYGYQKGQLMAMEHH